MKSNTEHLDKESDLSVANEVAGTESGNSLAYQFVDNRPQARVQKRLQDLVNNSTRSLPVSRLYKNWGLNVSEPKPTTLDSGVVQKRDRRAIVVWNVTHEVLPDENESLFGDDVDPFRNEGIELYKGELIIVDDEDIFQSRRGSNQEVEGNRDSDRAGHLTNKWLKLKEVKDSRVSGHGYVREETIHIDMGGQPDRRAISTEQVDASTAASAGGDIHEEWGRVRAKRRMSKGAWERWEKVRAEKGKYSSPSWDQVEEGHDVSGDLASENVYTEFEENSNQAIFIAKDAQTDAAIGIIVIEKRTTSNFPRHNNDNSKKWYLRWLIGHPTLKGAGGILMRLAVTHVQDNGGTAIWVESAPSATSWYESKGFELVSRDEQAQYNDEYEHGWDSPLMVKVL